MIGFLTSRQGIRPGVLSGRDKCKPRKKQADGHTLLISRAGLPSASRHKFNCHFLSTQSIQFSFHVHCSWFWSIFKKVKKQELLQPSNRSIAVTYGMNLATYWRWLNSKLANQKILSKCTMVILMRLEGVKKGKKNETRSCFFINCLWQSQWTKKLGIVDLCYRYV